jgi:hypothetical protein
MYRIGKKGTAKVHRAGRAVTLADLIFSLKKSSIGGKLLAP